MAKKLSRSSSKVSFREEPLPAIKEVSEPGGTVTFAAHEDQEVPADTVVYMRVGQVHKRAQLSNATEINFPVDKFPIDPKTHTKVEVFKRLGVADVCLDSSCGEVQEVEVPCNDPDFEKLHMDVTTVDCRDQTPGKVEKRKQKRAECLNSANRYLSDYQLEDLLNEAMKELLVQKPADPHEFIAQFILKHPSRRENGNAEKGSGGIGGGSGASSLPALK
mmetsp:Transcript_4853/g.7908  ORF Transcript_4853/g.7908 Transcript_4853/m.7908 type:complete len:219 (+) Transcript_4853:70-726(+)